MKAAALGSPFVIPFRERTCFQHIEEAVDIFVRCVDASPSEPVLSDMAADMRTTEEVAAVIRAVVPGADVVADGEERTGPPDLDESPLVRLLGDWPRISLEDGTRRTVARFREIASGERGAKGARD
jgi:UDP-glucuronate 4-epimerase